MEVEIQQLKTQIANLTARMNAKDSQQVADPLDRSSQQVVYKNVLLFKRLKPVTVVPKGIIVVEINGKDYSLLYT